jgi:DNA (cytosine-5)-methyltransferase 1
MKHYNYQDAESSVLELDITSKNVISKISNVVGNRNVDLIIGGPPCQSFSTLGRAKDGEGMVNDPRNFLFESYIKVLDKFKPKMFVFENVTGLLSAKINGKLIVNKILKELGKNYKVVANPNSMVLNSADYGVPQIRKRVIIIGVRKDVNTSPEQIYEGIKKTHFDASDKNSGNAKKYVTVKEAIGELPKLKQGEGEKNILFNPTDENDFLKHIRPNSKYELLDHVSRTHNELDVKRYVAMSKNKWDFSELLEKSPELSHPKARVFNNSYVVQHWNMPSKTIIAHLYKDGNQFIHPDYKQGRTLTPREAARLQSFPDDFVFEGSKTQQFKQIGNAVPPLFAEAIAKSIKQILNKL